MYIPLHLHTSQGSLLDGYSNPQLLVKRLQEIGSDALAVTDHGTLFAAISTKNALNKAGYKFIPGNEFYLCAAPSAKKDSSNRKLSHLCVLAKNKEGWQNLISAVSASNEGFYYRPRLQLEELAQYSKNLIAFSGHPGSDLGNICFTSLEAYRAETTGDASKYINDYKKVIELALKYKDIFNDFFIEIQLIDRENIPAVEIIAETLRKVSKDTGIPCVATADSHYTTREEAHIQRILLCSALKTTFKTVYNKLDNDEEVGLGGFFKSNNYHIPSLLEMQNNHTREEIANTILIKDMCEEFSLKSPPRLPKLYDDDNKKLREFCYSDRYNPSYKDRLEHELAVIEKNNLAGYFLTVDDFVRWAKSKDILVGIARGSAGGSLVSYLTGITQINPLEHGLIFERFYNEGRNTPGRVELPDIDIDFDKERREEVIQYLRDKYGSDKIGHILTLSSLQGRGAIKEVLRVYSACSQVEMNEITKDIPQESEISDKLEEFREAKGYTSILEWTLENEPDSIKHCKLVDGQLTGDMAKYFELAIQIEGVKKNTGKHASGIVIGDAPLSQIVPMHNQGGEMICGMEMDDLKDMGLVKFDLLSLNTLSKMDSFRKFLCGG